MNTFRTRALRLAARGIALCCFLLLTGCSIDLVSLRNCEKSGEAHYGGIPLASRTEHLRAERFTPDDASNCVLYIVRQKDLYSGGKVDSAYLLISSEEIKNHSLPINPILIKDQIMTIGTHLYAMWELPTGKYYLKAIFQNQYGYIHAYNLHVWQEKASAQVELNCQPGGLLFFAVGDRGFNHKIFLTRINDEEGKTYIRKGIRSIGFCEIDIGDQYRSSWREELYYKSCPP